MATIVGDVTGQQQRHHPLNIPHLVKTIKGFPVKVKLFQNTATIKNSGEGFHPTNSSSPFFFFCSFFFLDLNALDLAPIGNVALYLAITLSRSSTRCRTFKPTWDFIPDDAVECVAVWWIKMRVRVGGHIIILTEREGGSELILTLLEGRLSNFSFGEAHYRTPPSW